MWCPGQTDGCAAFLSVSMQAFVQYKSAAANSLSDSSLIRGIARSTGAPPPTFGAPRQLEALFTQHGLALMGHSVDVASAVAQHVQELLHQNAQYLVALCEVSHQHSVMMVA